MPMKVLIADDSKTIRTVVQMIFRKRDVQLVAVASGQEALDHARQDRPDVILADMHMEPGDGPWLATKAGTEVSLQGVPVILLTRGNDPPSPDRISEVGAAATLAKPFTSEQLLALIDDVAVKAPRSQTADDGQTREAAVPPDEPVSAEAIRAKDEEDDWIVDDDSGDVSAQAAQATAAIEPVEQAIVEPPAPAEQPVAEVAQAVEPEAPARTETQRESPLLAALRKAGRVFEESLASAGGGAVGAPAVQTGGASAPMGPQAIRRMINEALAERPPATQPAATVARDTTDAAQVKLWIEEALEVAKAEWLEAARRAAREIARQAATDAAEAMRGPLREAARKAAIEAAREATAAAGAGGGVAGDTAAAERVAWEVIPDLAERVLWELLPDVANDLAREVRKRA